MSGGVRWAPGELRAVMCSGKIAYKSAVEAGKAKDRMKRRSKTFGGTNVYRCFYCDSWHIGRRPKAKKGER